jgi:hypothetical protein
MAVKGGQLKTKSILLKYLSNFLDKGVKSHEKISLPNTRTYPFNQSDF